MHYDVLVIFSRPPDDVRSHVKSVLTPFYIENDERIRPRWDWFRIGDGPYNDSVAASSFRSLDESEKNCACRIGHLPADYSTAALLNPDGVWHDIEDFG